MVARRGVLPTALLFLVAVVGGCGSAATPPSDPSSNGGLPLFGQVYTNPQTNGGLNSGATSGGSSAPSGSGSSSPSGGSTPPSGGGTTPPPDSGSGNPPQAVVLPGLATNFAPANNSVNVALNPALAWNAGSGALSHDVYFGMSDAAVSAATRASVEFKGNQQQTSFAPGQLVTSTDYYWRVDEVNDAGTSHGTTYHFVTAPPPPPGAASYVSPPDGATNVEFNITLSWNAGAGATSYDVYVGTSSAAVAAATHASPEFRANVGETSFPLSSLAPSTTFYYRVDAVGMGGATAGGTYRFTTRNPPLSAPIISQPYEITDATQYHLTPVGPNPEASIMTRVGDTLYVVYRGSPGGPVGYRLYVRALDLKSMTMARAVEVADYTDAPEYHAEPTLLRDGVGRLHVLNQRANMISGCVNTFGIAPEYRNIRSLSDASSWTTPTCLPSRLLNDAPTGQFYDAMGVYDARAGVTHCVGQMYGMHGLDGRPQSGIAFPRGYYRILGDGTVDGPYVIVEAASNQPVSHPNGDVYTKGDLVLGREPAGQRSLHVVWNNRFLFDAGGSLRWWNLNLYHAMSRDGGQTWQPASGSVQVPLTEHVKWDDSRFLAVAGDVHQDSERAFDVDSQSRPFLVYMRYRTGTGGLYDGHADGYAGEGPIYDLCWQRWDGDKWVGGVIDNTINWRFARPKVRIDLDDNVYVFTDAPMRYYLSRNLGATWAPPVNFGDSTGWGWRLYSMADPLEPNYHYIAYQHRSSLKLYLVRMQLTNH